MHAKTLTATGTTDRNRREPGNGSQITVMGSTLNVADYQAWPKLFPRLSGNYNIQTPHSATRNTFKLYSMLISALVLGLAAQAAASPVARKNHKDKQATYQPIKKIELGPRPYYLINDMDEGPLKTKLSKCSNKEQRTSTFSIGHRGGGTLQFPEHTLESNLAGARMGAGVLECDTAFTKDLHLVCRHSNCDLHTTTNVVAIPELNAKCSVPFQPASNGTAATAKCCTSDFTLAEFKTLCGKMDAFDKTATTPEAYLGGIASWRTSLYNQCGTLMSHAEHIEMVKDLGLEFTPELKTPEVEMPFGGNYTQEMYAQQLVDDYKKAGVDPAKVWLQSFLYDDILYWLKAEPEFAKQAMYLDDNGGNTAAAVTKAAARLASYKKDGVKYIAPPFNYLLTTANGSIVPSDYAKEANKLGLGIVTWSLERSPPLAQVKNASDSYYSTFNEAIKKDGDIYTVIDVLYRQVGIKMAFSDWSATVTYYANCFGIGL